MNGKGIHVPYFINHHIEKDCCILLGFCKLNFKGKKFNTKENEYVHTVGTIMD